MIYAVTFLLHGTALSTLLARLVTQLSALIVITPRATMASGLAIGT